MVTPEGEDHWRDDARVLQAYRARVLSRILGACADGRLEPAEPRTPDTTTPTTLAEFARTTLAPAVRAFAM